jgi:hypothetical protein
VRAPNKGDWGKFVRLMIVSLYVQKALAGTLRWHVDASFAVHPDFRSHAGATLSMGKGAVVSISRKQGMNTWSLTEAEVVAADEVVGPMLWTRRFLEAQGYMITGNVLFQDNQSAMLLESNGRKSAGKRSRHLDIRFFFVTDHKERGLISIEFCPTEQMTADYMTKPLHGTKFEQFRQEIMNLPLSTHAQLVMWHCTHQRNQT